MGAATGKRDSADGIETGSNVFVKFKSRRGLSYRRVGRSQAAENEGGKCNEQTFLHWLNLLKTFRRKAYTKITKPGSILKRKYH